MCFSDFYNDSMPYFMVPTLTGKSQGILNRLGKSGNFTQNTGKMNKFYLKYWKNEDILASVDFLIEVHL